MHVPGWTAARGRLAFYLGVLLLAGEARGFDEVWCSRGTLFQWRQGRGESGGPNLDEPLVTDRPDFTEASSTVGRGVLQVEMGYTYFDDHTDGQRTVGHSYPETLFRYGVLADWLELRAAWNYAHESTLGANTAGAEDLYLGMKIGLTGQDGWLPEMALVPQMTVPTGANGFTSETVQPGVNWLYGWDINDWLSTGGSTQYNYAFEDAVLGGYHEFAQSWTVGYGLTEKLSAYTEWFAFFPHNAGDIKPAHYFDGGFTYLLSDDIQWDIRAGVGLNNAADDYFVGTGLSVRFK